MRQLQVQKRRGGALLVRAHWQTHRTDHCPSAPSWRTERVRCVAARAPYDCCDDRARGHTAQRPGCQCSRMRNVSTAGTPRHAPQNSRWAPCPHRHRGSRRVVQPTKLTSAPRNAAANTKASPRARTNTPIPAHPCIGLWLKHESVGTCTPYSDLCASHASRGHCRRILGSGSSVSHASRSPFHHSLCSEASVCHASRSHCHRSLCNGVSAFHASRSHCRHTLCTGAFPSRAHTCWHVEWCLRNPCTCSSTSRARICNLDRFACAPASSLR